MTIRLVRAELHADGRTDRQADRQAGRQAGRETGRQTNIRKLIVCFCSFANAPKTEKHEQELCIE